MTQDLIIPSVYLYNQWSSFGGEWKKIKLDSGYGEESSQCADSPHSNPRITF